MPVGQRKAKGIDYKKNEETFWNNIYMLIILIMVMVSWVYAYENI